MGRLAARPAPPPEAARPISPPEAACPILPSAPWPLPPGLHSLEMGGGRDGLLRVPENPALAGAPLPLVIMLHGAGSGAERALRRVLPIADAALVMLPESAGSTWDIIEEGGYGPDILRLDAALAAVLAGWPVDPARLVIAGFSDGASYALSLGLMNGDLFSHVLAFSPGFAAPRCIVGRADVFVSHGTFDEVLNIDHGSRRLVRQLGAGGWGHRYVEFDGGHTLPEPVLRAAWDYVNETAEETE
jgi:phospholipase/carboxylesterase